MLPTKFRFIWPNGFREEFKKISQSETRIICGGPVFFWVGTERKIFLEERYEP
jgi:hypothetical protein